ncbi:6-phosphogluconolactonase [Aquamicrobium lusatiense]|uniref:6-phosphogluconolactonase n=1 Tax=Aquamicrobium lusatiense TaxID=89772 RepID=A0A7W9VTY3_9HYPH|nr:6-phosphogluconolactonase [Aquamicrobium lusatiense]MBB6011418.1 6-phosphogluconolactonase [Aquamicrobium lusatiense]
MTAQETAQAATQGYDWTAFSDREALAETLADRVAETLSAAIERRGAGFLAVSGGTTPGRFFAALSSRPIAWDKVTVTLVDERFVPPSSPRSNAALVADTLLRNAASAARFAPLYHAADSAADAAIAAEAELATLPWPLDAAVLGMGTDGHTASFFPDADTLPDLLDPHNARIVLPVEAASAGEPRLTLSMPRLTGAGFLALHIEGAEKRAVFEAAMQAAIQGDDRKPIRAVIEASPRPVNVFWAP